MLSNRINISSGSSMEPVIGFSRAVRIGNVIAGTAPIGADGKTATPGDAYGQTKRCLEISFNAITEAGGSAGDVIRTRIMLTDVKTWREAARAHGEIFKDIRPACTFVEVKGFIDPELLFETEMDCVIEALQ